MRVQIQAICSYYSSGENQSPIKVLIHPVLQNNQAELVFCLYWCFAGCDKFEENCFHLHNSLNCYHKKNDLWFTFSSFYRLHLELCIRALRMQFSKKVCVWGGGWGGGVGNHRNMVGEAITAYVVCLKLEFEQT